jgi:hypothetical protein
MQPPDDVNLVVLSGQVIKIYPNGRTVALILSTPRGRFFVECAQEGCFGEVHVGDRVLARGYVFTRKASGGKDTFRVCASELTKILVA